MVAHVAGVFDEKLNEAIANSKILVVGAGGIGCEILKNLVLTGFPQIEIIDLDTIDVSNLNRQFLFHKEHVGKSKAQVARDSALSFNPNVNIVAHHDSVISNDYGVSYFKQFNIVLNALDNRVARNHVNRMCLAANVPLIETGTAGYAGQVELIKKGLTQCYECQPKAAQKTFPGCTIRNTPSEPIHCIVWAKHLFNQLFGEEDPDQDVSPDTADPEAAGEAGSSALTSETTSDGNIQRKSTRAWAAETNYDPEKLFIKLFHDDIRYLLSMENLWKKRRPPTPLSWDKLSGKDDPPAQHSGLPDQRVWSVAECVKVLTTSCKALAEDLKSRADGDHLVWDKDEKNAMDFVTACANIRAHIFNIPLKSRFEIKSMAGNIIPAIATANAIVAGLAVLRAQAILKDEIETCTSVYLRPKLNHRGQLFVPEKNGGELQEMITKINDSVNKRGIKVNVSMNKVMVFQRGKSMNECDIYIEALTPSNPKCYVCAPKPEVGLACNLKQLTLKDLNSALKDGLNMQAPDATVEGKGLVVLSSEPGETEHNNDKTLEELGLNDGCALMVDDFLQNYEVRVRLQHEDEEKNWRLVTDSDAPMPAPKENEKPTNGSNGEPKPGPSRPRHDSDSDMEIIEEDDDGEIIKPPKRRRTEISDEVVELC
ncbi:SUMO-activating enzyme subunit 2 [Eumeta japonica]|uniref:SUMO-activating enzyme subunit n=1 Tax=Eumeta variegata TaxID=151549 RepID=A0A4C1ZAW2_EUMVA|nr:SUMO-activating enzyme subunit 2 [Eumeta japonica]